MTRNYDEKAKEIKQLIALLQTRLEDHKRKQRKDDKKYGLVGDLAYVEDKLTELTSFLK